MESVLNFHKPESHLEFLSMQNLGLYFQRGVWGYISFFSHSPSLLLWSSKSFTESTSASCLAPQSQRSPFSFPPQSCSKFYGTFPCSFNGPWILGTKLEDSFLLFCLMIAHFCYCYFCFVCVCSLHVMGAGHFEVTSGSLGLLTVLTYKIHKVRIFTQCRASDKPHHAFVSSQKQLKGTLLPSDGNSSLTHPILFTSSEPFWGLWSLGLCVGKLPCLQFINHLWVSLYAVSNPTSYPR